MNIAWDARVFHDPGEKLSQLISRVRTLVERAGLERYRTPDGASGWRPWSGRLVPVEV